MMIEMKVRRGVVFVALFAGLGLSACGGGGGDDGTSASLPPPPVPIVPTVSLAANPTSIAYNASSTLSWSSTDATSCVASGDWSGNKTTSGNESTGPLTASSNYSLTCTSSGGSGSASATVTVTVSPPTTTLVWDAVTDPNLSGYRIYYGTASGTYLQSLGQGVNVGNVTTYTVTGLSSGTRYYFAATAYDTSNNESTYSNEVFKDIP